MTDDWQFWMNWSVNVVVAVGTVGAVIVALFGSGIQARLFAPKLVLMIDNPHGDATPVTVTAPTGSHELSKLGTTGCGSLTRALAEGHSS
jgi:hypothetical protein